MITLHPDKITFRGPAMDGDWSITLHVGQYEAEQISQLVQIPQDQITSVGFQEPQDFKDK